MDYCHRGSSCPGSSISSRRWLIKLASVFGALMLVLAVQAGSRAESASADTCSWTGSNWQCHWQAYLAPYTNRYFTSSGGNNLRSWFKAGVGDIYDGSVAAKCVNVVNSGGAATSVACGSGFPSNPVPTNYRPGYLYIFHWANGGRTITGAGAH
jgi:hypothetical protein